MHLTSKIIHAFTSQKNLFFAAKSFKNSKIFCSLDDDNHEMNFNKMILKTRRDIFKKSILLTNAIILLNQHNAIAAEGSFSQYIKKKPLDPLPDYVLPLLAAKEEIKNVGVVAENDVSEARSLLRRGALSSLRINIRAVGEYAERLETSTKSKELVSNVIKTIEALDSYLLRYSRNQKPSEDPKILISNSLDAIDTLLATVPDDIMKEVKL